MRWQLGSYIVKYNPKANEKDYEQKDDVNVTVKGLISNPITYYNVTQNFTIELYDKPTYKDSVAFITNSAYIAFSRDTGVLKTFYVLKNDGTTDVFYSSGNLMKTLTLSSGAVTIPTTSKPIDIAKYGSEVAYLYQDSSGTTILITDENGVGIRKYIYGSTLGTVKNITSDGNVTLYGVNTSGSVFSINKDSFSYTMELQTTATLGACTYLTKDGNGYLVIMKNNNIAFYDMNMNLVNLAEPKFGIADMNYCLNSNEYYMLTNGTLYKFYPNACRVDLQIIKSTLSNGQVTMYDEAGIPSTFSAQTINVSRLANSNEARYELQIQGILKYDNQSYGWTTIG